MASVEVSERADEWLEKAEPELRDRIYSKLRDVSNYPEHYLDGLKGSPFYKLRIGDYRVIIDWDQEENVLLVRRIGKRDGVYK